MDKLDDVIKSLTQCTMEGIPDERCENCPYFFCMPCINTLMADALELLKEQQPKWIPVSERLPKKEDIPYDCLVTLEHGVVCEATFLDMDAPYHKWCANTGWLYHVTHWMPMPKPPKDGEQCGR